MKECVKECITGRVKDFVIEVDRACVSYLGGSDASDVTGDHVVGHKGPVLTADDDLTIVLVHA